MHFRRHNAAFSALDSTKIVESTCRKPDKKLEID